MASPSAQHETSDAATRLAQAASKLTEDQRREVADFAEFLVDRPTHPPASQAAQANQTKPRKMNLEELRGSLAHLKDQYKSGVELQHAIVREDWDQVD